MEQKPVPEISPEQIKANNLKNFLIGIIVILSVTLIGLGAIFLYRASNNSQEITETRNNNTAPSGQISKTDAIPPTNEIASSSSQTETTQPTQEETKKADLYVKSQTFNKDPKMGTEFTITIVIENKGQAASGESYWEWWANSSKQVCKKKVGIIPAGGSVTVKCEYTYTEWAEYTTKVVVDSQNNVDESNESNNVATKEVTPKHDKADLTVTNYEFNHDPVKGEEFKVEITIKNEGETDAEDFKWEWWSNAYSSSCDGEIDKLEAGKSKEVSCEYTYASWSTYATKAVVDPDDDVDEEEENNNTSTKNIIPIH